jgi:hypothetical protein
VVADAGGPWSYIRIALFVEIASPGAEGCFGRDGLINKPVRLTENLEPRGPNSVSDAPGATIDTSNESWWATA